MNLTLDGPQAGLLLAASVSLADDDPSPAETAALKKYYTRETAQSLESRFLEAGVEWPRDRAALEGAILARLKEATEAFRLRSLAIALELAEADGRVDQEELRFLARYATALGTSLADADRYRKEALREVEYGSDYSDIAKLDSGTLPLELELAPREAVAALVTLVAAADDDASDAEMVFIREYCAVADFEGLSAKLKAAGGAWPDDLSRCLPSLLRAIRGMDRKGQLRALTLTYRTAMADGVINGRELDLLKDFCNSLQIGLGELEACAPVLESLYRSV
jgi:uncharacterized tellurite resistance protein B-like protein